VDVVVELLVSVALVVGDTDDFTDEGVVTVVLMFVDSD